MKLKRYLTEIKMTKQTEFYGTTNRWGDEWETKFKVGEWDYEVIFTKWGSEWSLVFKLTDSSLWKLGEFGGGTGFDYSLTKLGNPIQVFRGVLQALKKWNKDVGHTAKMLTFSAENDPDVQGTKEVEQRMRLYKKAVPQIEKITGMKFFKLEKRGSSRDPMYSFIFKREE